MDLERPIGTYNTYVTTIMSDAAIDRPTLAVTATAPSVRFSRISRVGDLSFSANVHKGNMKVTMATDGNNTMPWQQQVPAMPVT